MDIFSSDNPFVLFRKWFAEAERTEPNDPNAMALATAGVDGQPAVRMVLMKDWNEQGFVFYTNLESNKGRNLAENPKAALLFHWKSLERQVRVEGTVSPVTPEEADAYFNSRARLSRLGAWASDQSRPLESFFALEKRVAQVTAKYPMGKIPRPPHWSGFRVKPERMEFWKSGDFRLHRRMLFLPNKNGEGWSKTLLFP